MAEETNMSFLQHLEELRWRLVRSAIAVIIFGTVIWIYQEKIMNEIFLKMVNKDFITFFLLSPPNILFHLSCQHLVMPTFKQKKLV
jgi:Sec-independent protein secretion pathway component TatC